MNSAERIPTGLKTLLNEKMPSDHAGHVLAVGNFADKQLPKRVLITYLKELIDDHNVGTLAFDFPPYMNVFLWAYRDGNLPVSKQHSTAYLNRMFSYLTNPENAVNQVGLSLAAIDHGIDVVHTSRDQIQHSMARGNNLLRAMRELLNSQPVLLEQLRANPEEIKNLARRFIASNPQFQSRDITLDNLTRAFGDIFVTLEAERLMLQHPSYKRWVDNIEAVNDAGVRMHVGEDALSAAILKSSSHAKRNIVVNASMESFINVSNPQEKTQGALARHLTSMGLPVVVMGFAVVPQLPDLAERFSPSGKYYRGMWASGHPTLDIPKITVFGVGDRIGFQRNLDGAVKHYQHHPNPNPHIYGPAFVGKMNERLDGAEITGLTSRLHDPYNHQR